MAKIILFLILVSPLMADNSKDQKFKVGKWSFSDDKKAHFFAGFACYSIADRMVENKPIKYSVVALFAASKEVIDSWNTSGTLSDFTYTIVGAIACDLTLKLLRLENKKKLKVQFNENKVYLAWVF